MIEQDSIVFRIERETPISLERLTFGMMALGAEYERFVKSEHPKISPPEAELLVQRVTEKCIWIELIGAISPVLQGMDNIIIFSEFVKMLGVKLGALTAPEGRIEDTTTKELVNLTRMMETIVGDTQGEAEIIALNYNSETKEKTTQVRIVYKAKDSQLIIDNAEAQIREITGPESNVHNGVLMRLFQTNLGEAVADRSSGEKGIIESITDRPRRLIYASDLAGQRIKSAWAEEGQNPYELGFVVDVDVQMVDDKPRAYRIMDVHEIFPLDEDDD